MEQTIVEIQKYGAARDLVIRTQGLADNLKDDEVVVDVHYSGVNFADIVMRLGMYQDAPKKPFVPGYEVSGVIAQVGSKVTRLKVGDKVMAGTRFGGYANRVVIPEGQAVKLSENVPLDQGAALPVNFITAHIALNEFGRIRQGDKILLDCATGGVGVVCMQMAVAAGAHVIGLTTTESKKDFIRSYGATPYTFAEFAASKETQFDFILNSSGGASLKQQYKLLNRSGKLVCIGLQAAIQDGRTNYLKMLSEVVRSPFYPILKLTMDSRMVGGFNALKFFDDPIWMQRALAELEKTQVRPHVGQTFDYNECWKAHECLENKQARGKVLIRWR